MKKKNSKELNEQEEIKKLEKRLKELEEQAKVLDIKLMFLDKMIEIADEKYNIDIKNQYKESQHSEKKKK